MPGPCASVICSGMHPLLPYSRACLILACPVRHAVFALPLWPRISCAPPSHRQKRAPVLAVVLPPTQCWQARATVIACLPACTLRRACGRCRVRALARPALYTSLPCARFLSGIAHPALHSAIGKRLLVFSRLCLDQLRACYRFRVCASAWLMLRWP